MDPKAHDQMLRRIVDRHLIAKGISLVPAFKQALHAFTQGHTGPVMGLIQQVIDIIFPSGTRVPAPWFNALDPDKQSTIIALDNEGRFFLKEMQPRVVALLALDLSRFKGAPDPEAARKKFQADHMREYVRRLESWGSKLRTLEVATQAEDKERALHHGGFTIIPMPGVKRNETAGALATLDAAAEKIRAKFPQVLYGTIYLATKLSAHTSALYSRKDDTIHVNVRTTARFSDVYTLVHEFGHRYDYKHINADQRKAFTTLPAVTPYGATDPRENFAEGFAHYVLGMSLPEPVATFLKVL